MINPLLLNSAYLTCLQKWGSKSFCWIGWDRWMLGIKLCTPSHI